MGNCTGGGDVEVSGEGFWLLGLGLLFCFLSVLSRGRDCLDPVSSLLFTFGTDCWARLPLLTNKLESGLISNASLISIDEVLNELGINRIMHK